MQCRRKPELAPAVQANPSQGQRQLAAHMGASLGKANYCLRALVAVVIPFPDRDAIDFAPSPSRGRLGWGWGGMLSHVFTPIRELRNLIAHEYAADKMAEIYEAVFILPPELGKIAALEEKTRIAQAFLKRKEAEFDAIRREIETLKGELESSGAGENNGCPIFTCCPLLKAAFVCDSTLGYTVAISQ